MAGLVSQKQGSNNANFNFNQGPKTKLSGQNHSSIMSRIKPQRGKSMVIGRDTQTATNDISKLSSTYSMAA